MNLRVTRCEGAALELSWTWPDCEQRISLGAVMQALCLSLQDADQAMLVELYLEPSAGGHALMLEHRCSDLRCSLNGKWVLAGDAVKLQHGDVLDVGLCRFEVDMPEAVSEPAPPSVTYDDVDLSGLASKFERRSPDAAMLEKADDLDDLLASSWESQAELAVPDESAPAVGNPSEPEGTAQAHIVDANLLSEDSGLEHWHARYLRQLHSPHERPVGGQWVGMSSLSHGAGADAYDRLAMDALDGPDLATLLGQETHISAVLAQLSPHAERDILAAEKVDNVMHLFAPDNWSPQSVHSAMPGLTRQEHHVMYLDSAVLSVQTVQPSTNEKPQP